MRKSDSSVCKHNWSVALNSENYVSVCVSLYHEKHVSLWLYSFGLTLACGQSIRSIDTIKVFFSKFVPILKLV